MNVDKQKAQPAATQVSSRLVASRSGNELALIQQGDQVLIDAQVVHRNLKVKTRLNDWIQRRIEECGFEEGFDFYSKLSNQNPTGRGGDRRAKTYLLTLDMAKELAMLEKSEAGKTVRRYFIEKEKELRAVSQLPREAAFFKGLKARRINDRVLYPYQAVLERAGYSTKTGGSRRHRYWMHFVKEGSTLYVTQEFALHLYHSRQVMNNRAAMLATQPVLALEFYEQPQKGGAQ